MQLKITVKVHRGLSPHFIYSQSSIDTIIVYMSIHITMIILSLSIRLHYEYRNKCFHAIMKHFSKSNRIKSWKYIFLHISFHEYTDDI